MSMQTFTVGEITTCLGCPQRQARKLLKDAGAQLDECTEDLDEQVPVQRVIDLYTIRGDDIGRRLGDLLRVHEILP